MSKSPNKSLYVHIPFCRHLCPYCDFPKVFHNEDWAKSYLSALKQEIQARCDGLYRTIYIGGGTPTCLSEDNLRDLLAFLSTYRDEICEWSIEANPDSLTEEKIALVKEAGVTRVSLGVQTSTEQGLKTLGRTHSFDDAKKAIEHLRKAGFNSINVDWMYGYPGQTMEMVEEDIRNFLSLSVPHLSAYSLILEEGTAFFTRKVKPLEDDVQQGMFERIREALKQAGYQRYEVSNFALPGHECEHNLAYWKDLDYVGVGLGAAGSLGDIRYRNTRNLSEYLSGHHEGEIEHLDEHDHKEVFFLTNLRLVEGFALSEYQKRFGSSFLEDYREAFEELKASGLLEEHRGNIRTSERGMDLLDTVLVRLFR